MITRFTILSDTHGMQSYITLPKSDYLLICGDFSNRGNKDDIKSFKEWIKVQPVKNIVMILGNHECQYNYLSESIQEMKRSIRNITMLDSKIQTINQFQFYGMSYPFKYDANTKNYLMKKLDKTKPLITLSHEPPYDILDYGIYNRKIVHDHFYHAGNKTVRAFVNEIKPTLHCFGHCHTSHGVYQNGVTTFVNAAIVDDCNVPFKKPIQLDYVNNKFILRDKKKYIDRKTFVRDIREEPFDYITTHNELI